MNLIQFAMHNVWQKENPAKFAKFTGRNAHQRHLKKLHQVAYLFILPHPYTHTLHVTDIYGVQPGATPEASKAPRHTRWS